jgi:hypothetical protein
MAMSKRSFGGLVIGSESRTGWTGIERTVLLPEQQNATTG